MAACSSVHVPLRVHLPVSRLVQLSRCLGTILISLRVELLEKLPPLRLISVLQSGFGVFLLRDVTSGGSITIAAAAESQLASLSRQEVADEAKGKLEHLGQRDDRDADPQSELTADVRDELRRQVVGRLRRDDDTAVGDVDVESREVLHALFSRLVREVLRHDVVLGRAEEAVAEALDVEDVEVGGVALVAAGRPLRQAVGDVVEDLGARRVAAALLQQRRVLLSRVPRLARALDAVVQLQQDLKRHAPVVVKSLAPDTVECIAAWLRT